MKPVILVPVSMLTLLDHSEIEMILVHELAHIRRYDVIINIMQTIVETLFFFNPAIWWISRRIRIEREDCCDDMAIVSAGSRLRYARALINLEELRMNRTCFGTAITGTPLERRIRRIVGAVRPRFYSSTLSISGMLLTAFLIVIVIGSLGSLKNSAVQASERIEVTQGFDPKPGDLRGEWEAESISDGVRILVYGRRSSGMSYTLSQAEVACLVDQGEKTFQIVRDAGNTYLKGTLSKKGRRVVGDGEWYFRPDSAYVHFMSRYGLRKDDLRRIFSFAVQDVSREYVSRMEDLGYRGLDLDQWLSARIQNITPEYVEEFRKAGYSDLSYNQLLSMRIQGVTIDDAREFERLGVGRLTADQLVSARVQGMSPEYAEEFQEAGAADLTYDELLSMRVQGVTLDDAREFEKLGLGHLSAEQLTSARVQGMSPEYVRRLQKAGCSDLSFDKLLSMKVQGVTANDLGEFEDRGFGHLTADQLVSARVQGVSPEFVEEFQKAGFRNLSFNSFITLRAFGIDADDFADCYRHRFMDLSEDNMVWVCGFGITKEDIVEMQRRGYTDIDTIIRILARRYGR